MKFKKYEITWMILFGIGCAALMIHEHVFNGLAIIPLIPLIGKGIGAMLRD